MNIKLEFSDADINDEDWAISEYPFGVLAKMLLRANEIGIEGKKIDVVEVKENFATGRKYVDFIIKD